MWASDNSNTRRSELSSYTSVTQPPPPLQNAAGSNGSHSIRSLNGPPPAPGTTGPSSFVSPSSVSLSTAAPTNVYMMPGAIHTNHNNGGGGGFTGNSSGIPAMASLQYGSGGAVGGGGPHPMPSSSGGPNISTATSGASAPPHPPGGVAASSSMGAGSPVDGGNSSASVSNNLIMWNEFAASVDRRIKKNPWSDRIVRHVAECLDIQCAKGYRNTVFVLWGMLSCYCLARIALSVYSYLEERTLFAQTDRSVYDYGSIWALVCAVFMGINVIFYIGLYLFRPSCTIYATTGFHVQCVVSFAVLCFVDRLPSGMSSIITTLPLVAVLIGSSTSAVMIGWLSSTIMVVIVSLSARYFPSFFRFHVDHSLSVLYVCSYVVSTCFAMMIPLCYNYWLRKAKETHESSKQFTIVICKLLLLLNTTDAIRRVNEEEERQLAMDPEGDRESWEARQQSQQEVFRALRELAVGLSRYRSYLPNSIFAEMAAVQGGAAGDAALAFEDEDEDDREHAVEGADNSEGSSTMHGARASLGSLNSSLSRNQSTTHSHGGAGGGGGAHQPGHHPHHAELFPMEVTSFRRRRGTVMLVHVSNEIVDVRDVQRVAEILSAVVISKVIGFRGVVDRLTPTTILATFNGHLPCPLHASDASYCALSIAQELRAFPDLRFSIVIASGYCYVGTCGVDMHRAKVVLGAPVELVHRLMPLVSQTLLASIVVTEDTFSHLEFDTAPIDCVQFRPFTSSFLQSSTITLLELRSARRENTPHLLAQYYTSAFAALRDGNFPQSKASWINYLERNPMDLQAKRLLAVCDDVLHSEAYSKQFEKGYARPELQWEVYPVESQLIATSQQLVVEEGALAGQVDNGTSPAKHGDDLGAALREQFHNQQKMDFQEGGLFDMFVMVDEDDDFVMHENKETDGDSAGGGGDRSESNGVPSTAMPSAAAQANNNNADGVNYDALSTEVPRTFDDSNRKRWHRSVNMIGEGAFGRLYLALGGSGDLVAIKCFNLMNSKTQQEELIQELNTLSSLRNDYIVGYVGYAITPNYFIILMEYVSGGSLASMLQQFGPLPVPAAKRYLKDILRGLRYLHENRTTHCDIKPHNALLANDGTCKLSDFGSSVQTQLTKTKKAGDEGVEESAAANNNATPAHAAGGGGDEQQLVRGTSWYLAPEAARGLIMPANDIWSLGITFIEMLTGSHPWVLATKMSEAAFIIALGKDEQMVPPMPAAVPSDAQAFVQLCLVRDPAKRPTAQQLLVHPFLT